MKNLSDRFIRQVMDAAPEACAIVDRSGLIVFANKQVGALFGYEPDLLIGSSIDLLLPERYRDAHPGHRQSFFQNPRIRPMGQGLKLFGLRRDGSEFPIEISLSPVDTDQGLYVASSIRDATLQRDMEEQLTGILEKSLNEIYIFNAYNLKFIQVNEGARKNLGYSMEELQEMTPLDIKTEYSAEQLEQLIKPLRDNIQENLVFETTHRRKDGSTYPVEIHMQQSLYQSNPVFTAIVLDISERKLAEKVLRESHELLERKVIERTAALVGARAEAENANRGKTRFLAAASHDLRQPLQSLGLYLSVLKRHLDSPGQLDLDKLPEIAEKMRTSLDTMGQLLDALLDISKLDGGSVKPEKCDTRVGDILDSVLTSSIQQAQAKGLKFDCIGDDCVIYTDPSLLQRVVENFVTNAIRYTEQGQVCIECQRSEGFARILVSDTGIGIPENMLDKVFDEYYQLDNQVRDQSKGLGLGLSIARHIAKLLGHRLSVTSEPGKGSTFAVEVPLGSLDTGLTEEMAEKGAAGAEINTEDWQPLVLLVDDDLAILDATQMLLELSGIQVTSASNGDQALQYIESGICPDVLISDYRLPNYNGIELVGRARALYSKELPAVLITGDTSGIEIEAAGLDNLTLLHKPVDTEHLVLLIEKLSRQSHISGQ